MQQKQTHDLDDGTKIEDIQSSFPLGIDSVKKIGLTRSETRAIFFSLKKEIKKSKLRGEFVEPLKG